MLTLGEEDKMSLCLNPFDLGSPVNWFREYWNYGVGDNNRVKAEQQCECVE